MTEARKEVAESKTIYWTEGSGHCRAALVCSRPVGFPSEQSKGLARGKHSVARPAAGGPPPMGKKTGIRGGK